MRESQADRWPTPFTDLVGIDLPVVQAPIGSATTPQLAAAVSEAGGLGTLALAWTDVTAVPGRIAEARALTNRPIGVNVVLEWDQHERITAALKANVHVVSTFWGDPTPYVSMCRDAGAVLVHTVGSVDEARRAADAGVEAIVAQGAEAGGHVRGQVSTMALVPTVVDAVAPLPVLAAGGIGDGRGLAAALALGADGGWIGSAFLVAEESAAHADYRTRLIDARATDTVLSGVFDRGWPNAPHRALQNSTVRTWQAAGSPPSGSRPGEDDVIGYRPDGVPLYRYADDLPTSDLTCDVEPLAHYCGQSVGMISARRRASAIVHDLVAVARARLRA